MSRTDKDRPYWVKCNDETLLRYTDHDHVNLGRTYYRSVPVRDAYNRIVYETVETTRTVFRYGAAQRFGVNEWDVEEYQFTTGDYEKYAHLYRKETFEYDRPLVRRVPIVTYKDYCTEGEPRTKDGRSENPCQYHLTLQSFHYGKPTKDQRKTYSSHQRAKTRDTLKGLTKQARWSEIDEDASPETDVLEKNKWWWD